MTKSDSNLSAEILSTRAINQIELPVLAKQIRLCRSTLGAVLEELEAGEMAPESLEKIAERSMAAMAEIESLWETTKTIIQR